MDGIAENQPTRLGQIFSVTEMEEDMPDAVMTKGSQIAHLDRLYYESADYQKSGDAILERHENYSPDGVPERLRLDNILLRHPMLTPADAQTYKDLMLKAEFTYPDAISYVDRRIRTEGYFEATSWLEEIAQYGKPAIQFQVLFEDHLLVKKTLTTQSKRLLRQLKPLMAKATEQDKAEIHVIITRTGTGYDTQYTVKEFR